MHTGVIGRCKSSVKQNSSTDVQGTLHWSHLGLHLRTCVHITLCACWQG